jgi:hypothetical protein
MDSPRLMLARQVPSARIAAVCAVAILGLGSAHRAEATSISYVLASLSGNTWQYDFAVADNSLNVPIGEFTLFFNYGTFSNLNALSQPANFANPSVVQPVLPIDPVFPVAQDGFVDYLASTTGIAPNANETGFLVDVRFSGAGTPAGPAFTVVDANFRTIDSGTAVPMQSVSVPEPATLGLFGLGLMGTFLARRRAARREHR